MYIKHDEYELLEFFGSEPTYIPCQDSGVSMYVTEDSNGIKIVMVLSFYECKCTIDLVIHEKRIFTTSLDNVEYLRAESGGLKIHQKDATRDYIIFFKPNIFLKIE